MIRYKISAVTLPLVTAPFTPPLWADNGTVTFQSLSTQYTRDATIWLIPSSKVSSQPEVYNEVMCEEYRWAYHQSCVRAIVCVTSASSLQVSIPFQRASKRFTGKYMRRKNRRELLQTTTKCFKYGSIG